MDSDNDEQHAADDNGSTLRKVRESSAWWQLEAQRSEPEKVMEAVLCSARHGKGSKLHLANLMQRKNNHRSAIERAGFDADVEHGTVSLLKLKHPPTGVTVAHIERYLVHKAAERVAACERACVDPEAYADAREHVKTSSVPFLRPTLAQLEAQGAVINENAGLINVQAQYRVSQPAFEAVQALLAQRIELEGASAVSRMQSLPERHAATAKKGRAKRKKAKSLQTERRASKEVRSATKTDRQFRAGKRAKNKQGRR
jgi:hypothetical protein